MVFVAGYLRRAVGRFSLSVVVSPRDEGIAAKFPAVEEVVFVNCSRITISFSVTAGRSQHANLTLACSIK